MKKITIYVLSNMLLALIGSPHQGVSLKNDINRKIWTHLMCNDLWLSQEPRRLRSSL